MSNYLEIDKLAEQAEQFITQNRLVEAEKLLVRALKVNSEHARSLYSLGRIAEVSGAKTEALNLIGRAAYLAPKNPTPLLHLADLLIELNKPDEAKNCFELCMQRFPQVVEVHIGYAGILVSDGKTEKALEILKNALTMFPDNASLMLALVNTDSNTEYDNLKEKLLLLGQNQTLQTNEQMKVHYALAKIYDFQKHYQQAFSAWKKANAIQYQQCHFKTEQLADGFNQIKKRFEGINKTEEIGLLLSDSEYDCMPIFVIGLPRSGTTLVEQVMASHSQVESIGESDIVATQIIRMVESATGQPYPDGINKIEQEQRKAIGLHLCKLMAEKGGGKKFIIDKLPANFQSVG
ncbi:MAG: tetratricopeptide repeat protein, partial [Kangiellaceae bacterium]|nr:tetratricopeptide repeat protein [Kangiellaceae bacterium]